MCNELPVRVEKIQDGIGILLIRCCEGNNLVVLIGLSKTFVKVWTNVYSGVGKARRAIFFIIERDADEDVGGLSWILKTMNHCLVDVEDHCLFYPGPKGWQIDRSLELVSLFEGSCMMKHLERAHCLQKMEPVNFYNRLISLERVIIVTSFI